MEPFGSIPPPSFQQQHGRGRMVAFDNKDASDDLATRIHHVAMTYVILQMQRASIKNSYDTEW